MLCAIANASSYGGGMRVAPNGDMTDGLFDVVLVGALPRTAFLRAFPSVFHGTHLAHPKVKVFRAARVRISSPHPLPVLADGESVAPTPLNFEVLPQALTLMVPSQ